LRDDVNCGLRRGAWYRVVQLTPGDAVVEVQRKRVNVPRAVLTIVAELPTSWTVVTTPPDAKGLATAWQERYAVCPSCRNRAPIRGQPQHLRCPRCNGLFKVGWEDWLVGSDG